MVDVVCLFTFTVLWYYTWRPPPQSVSAVLGFGVWKIGIRALFIVNQVYQPIKDILIYKPKKGLKHSDQESIL